MSLLTIAQATSAKSNAGSKVPSAIFPATPTNGRQMLACIVAEEGTGDVTITLAGWTLIKTVNNTTNEVMSVYQKTAGASEPQTVTGGLTGTRRWVMWIAELANANATLVDISDFSTGTSSVMSSASIATNFPDEHWFAFFGAKSAVNMGSPTNGFVEILESSTNNGTNPDVTLGIYDKDVSATGTAQVNVTASASVKYSSIILAVRAVITAVTYTKTGLVMSGGSKASGADSHTAARTGKVISTHNVSGARQNIGLSKAGIVITDSASGGGFGEDPFGYAAFGQGSQKLSGFAIKIQTTGAKTGSVIAGLVKLSGGDATTHQETAQFKSNGSAASGDGIPTHSKAGVVISPGVSSGASIRIIGGAKTGKVTSNGLVISGPDGDIHPRTGIVYTDHDFSGADVSTHVETGKVTSVYVFKGSTAGPQHIPIGTYILPYNINPPKRKDERIVIGAEEHERSY